MRTGISFTVSPTDRRRLAALVKDRNTPQKHVWRAEIILLSAEGAGTMEIMRRTGKSKTCVWRWQERFAEEGVDGLLRDKTRPSRIPPLGPEVAERVVALTLADPPGETTHWTAEMMAKAAGISASAVRRIWKAHGLQPHRWRRFKLSNDPNFVAKLRDVVGLYVDPPAHAIVLSVDEKSQIQALDRTQPGLPMKQAPWRSDTAAHASIQVVSYARSGRGRSEGADAGIPVGADAARGRLRDDRGAGQAGTCKPGIHEPGVAADAARSGHRRSDTRWTAAGEDAPGGPAGGTAGGVDEAGRAKRRRSPCG